jgi:predicted HicB family RNase H-like nuclease
VEELPGCSAHGESAEDAAAAVQKAIAKWIADAQAEGREVPKPRSAASYSGRLLVRMPQSLHAELARAAERDEVSLNQFITGSLASAVRWRGASNDGVVPEDSAGQPPERRAGYFRTALVANVALLALIAALAVALLIIAVTRS